MSGKSVHEPKKVCPWRPRLGLDSSLHPALGDVGRDGAAPAHGPVGARPIGCRPRAHAKRKLHLQGVQRVAALDFEPLHLRFVQGGSLVHVYMSSVILTHRICMYICTYNCIYGVI